MPERTEPRRWFDIVAIMVIGILAILFGMLAWRFSQPKLDGISAALYGIITAVIGLAFDLAYAMNRCHLSRLSDEVGNLREVVQLQCTRDNRLHQSIADCLHQIIRYVNRGHKVETAFKRLNGVRGILSREATEEGGLAEVLRHLEPGQTPYRFIATSVVSFSDWIDPEWSIFLTRQLLSVATLRGVGPAFTARRYFLYSSEEVYEGIYADEIKKLRECHKHGRTEMIAYDLTKFGLHWITRYSQEILLDTTISAPVRNHLEAVDRAIRACDDWHKLSAIVPDMICAGNAFWWRDESVNYRLRRVHVSENPRFEAWVLILDRMCNERIQTLSWCNGEE